MKWASASLVAQRFAGRRIAKAHWLQYTRCISEHDTQTYKLLLKLLKRDVNMDMRDDER